MALTLGDEFDAEQYTMHDTFEDAMEAVAQEMPAPVSWNEWQRLAAAVRTGYPRVPMDIKALAALRRVTMEDRFGPEW